MLSAVKVAAAAVTPAGGELAFVGVAEPFSGAAHLTCNPLADAQSKPCDVRTNGSP